MNKKLLLVSAVAILATLQVKAQTKIGGNPATLNVNAILELESATKGLLLPRLALTGTNTIPPMAGTSIAAGMTAYNTATAGTGVNAVTPGYYYHNGTVWVRIASQSDIIASSSAWVNNPGATRVELGATSTGGNRAAGTEVVATDGGRFGIGTSSPSTTLDVNGSVRVRVLPEGSSATATTPDQIVTTDINGNFRKLPISTIVNGSETKISNTGSNVVITGTGTNTDPYMLNSVAENATSTNSNAITASTTQVAVSATNVQGAISDLATAIKTVQNSNDGSQTKVTAGTNVSVTGTGTTATPYVVNSPVETAANTPSTAITASSTKVAVTATNVQGAIDNLATAIITNKANGSETKISNTGSNVVITGTGTATDPYMLNSVAENATSTNSNAITASTTQVAVSATNVQGAISDLATAIIANKANGSETKISNTGSNVVITGTGTTADPYKLNSVAESAASTSNTVVNASATSVSVPAGNVQTAIESLAQSIITNKVKLANGTNTTVSGTGTTADPYKVNGIPESAANTSNTVINATSTSVGVPAGNVQNALAVLATSIAGQDGTDDAWVNNTTTNVVELKTKSNGTTTRTNGTQFIIKDNGSTVIGSSKLTYPSRLTLVSDNISTSANSYLDDNLEVLSFGNNANNSPYPVVDISSSFGTEASPANFPNCTSSPIGVGAVRWNARAGGNKVEVARIGVSYIGNGSTSLGEMNFTTNGNDNQLVLSSSGGVGVGMKTTTSSFAVEGLKHYNDNTAAKNGGLKVGDFFRTLGDVRVVY